MLKNTFIKWKNFTRIFLILVTIIIAIIVSFLIILNISNENIIAICQSILAALLVEFFKYLSEYEMKRRIEEIQINKVINNINNSLKKAHKEIAEEYDKGNFKNVISAFEKLSDEYKKSFEKLLFMQDSWYCNLKYLRYMFEYRRSFTYIQHKIKEYNIYQKDKSKIVDELMFTFFEIEINPKKTKWEDITKKLSEDSKKEKDIIENSKTININDSFISDKEIFKNLGFEHFDDKYIELTKNTYKIRYCNFKKKDLKKDLKTLFELLNDK